MAERDPTIILWWLRHRVDRSATPAQQVAIELTLAEAEPERTWLLLARDTEPNLCLEDPMLGEDRYVYVESAAAGLLPVARGERSWADAIADRTVTAYGPPDLVAALPGWFAR